MTSIVQQNNVVEELTKSKAQETPHVKTEDILTANLIQHSVNKIWNDYDKSKDGRLTYEESKDFINDSFGG